MVSLAAIAELSKADVTTAVAVVTELFQRYKEFITPLRAATSTLFGTFLAHYQALRHATRDV